MNMYRYIKAEQLIGTIFIYLLNNKKTQISLSELFKIIKKIEIELSKKNNATVLLPTEEFYNAVNSYGIFFYMDNDTIKLSDTAKERYYKNSEEFTDTLDSYFRAGIPNDIRTTIINVMLDIPTLLH